jgi:hypothetical protein
VRVTIIDHAKPGDVYAPTAFDSQIGKSIPVIIGDRSEPGILVAAEVVSEGRAVKLTLEIDSSLLDGSL